jgi:hypothetical protein
MSHIRRKPLDVGGLLQLSQWQCEAGPDCDDNQANYRDLLRYTLQIAAEREVVAGVLAELRELLEEYAPAWYAGEPHERVEPALELLQRL